MSSTSSSSPVWLITGVSSGFGLSIALHALKQQQRVIGTVRSRGGKSAEAVSRLEAAGAQLVELDMAGGEAGIRAAASAAAALHGGRLDVVVNNAGYALIGAVEDVDGVEVRRQLETNFFGPVALVRAVLPGMRARGAGVVVNVSSTAGLDGYPACGLYAASKFALEGFSESLAREVAPFGIATLLVEPGATRTNFQSAISYVGGGSPSEPYRDGAVGQTVEWLRKMVGSQPGDPDKGAAIIVKKVLETMGEKRTDVKRIPLGSDAIDRMKYKIDQLSRDMNDGEADAKSADF